LTKKKLLLSFSPMSIAENETGNVLPSLCDPVFQTWISPLGENSPCGEDISFSDEFESLKEEAEKEGSLHGGRSTDWALVLRMASRILADRSKDLWVLCYGIVAAFETQGLVSCAAALSALACLLHEHWDELHPGTARIQRRIAPLAWLAKRLESRFSSLEKEAELPAIAALHKELVKIQAILNARVGDKAPALAGLLPSPRAETSGHGSATQHAVISNGVLSAPSIPSAQSAPPDDLLVALEGDGRVPAAVLPRLFRTTQDQCRQLATHFSSIEPQDWRVIMLNRAALWCTIDQLPPADTTGVTQLRPVPLERAQGYSAAVEARKFTEVLPQLEGSAGKAPFWFDGHFLVARCLEGLEAHGALLILRVTLAQLLARFPELGRYKFQDGTPFASPRTMQWLDALDASFAGSAALRVSLAPGESAREQELLDESLAMNAEKGFQAGLAHLEKYPAGRSRAAMRQGMLMARYCVAAGNRKAAVRLLQSLYAQLEKWRMLDWEPELSAGIIALLVSLRPKEKGEAAETMMGHLYRLHLGTAVGTFKDT
jgi:type VI secretion system protein VasJ